MRRRSTLFLTVLVACSGGSPATSSSTSSIVTPAATAPSPAATARPQSGSDALSSTTEATGDTSVSLQPPAEPCAFGAPELTGLIEDNRLEELSGLVVSRLADHLWTLNDSGGGPFLYAVTREGATLATVELADVFALDWEDLAAGPGPDGTPHLFVADVGDNLTLRPFVTIYRLPEPDPVDSAVAADRLDFVYPDGSRDAEAAAVDPIDGDLFIISKGDDEEAAAVYRAAAASLVPGARISLERLAELGVDGQVTSADFSATGDRLFVRTYDEVFVYPRLDDDLIATSSAPPCRAPSAEEPQGEAIAADPTGGFFTVSEGRNQALWQSAELPAG